MSIAQCPKCQTYLRIPEKAENRLLECPKCKHPFRLPTSTKLTWSLNDVLLTLTIVFAATIVFIIAIVAYNSGEDTSPYELQASITPPTQAMPPHKQPVQTIPWSRDDESERLRTQEERRRTEQDRLAKEAERARREKLERQAVLQDGTNDFVRIMAYPERYELSLFYFNGLFGSRFGNMYRDKKENCYTVAFTCQKKYISPSRFGLTKNEINFVVPDNMGEKLLALRDSEFFARIYCRIRYGDPDNQTYPMAVIYRIEFHSDATCKGTPEIVVE